MSFALGERVNASLRWWTFLAASVAMAFPSAVAHAESEPASDEDEDPPSLVAPRRRDDFTNAPFAIALNLGFGTPVGLLGATVEWDPDSHVAIGGGAGFGAGGLQLAALARFRPLVFPLKKRTLAVTLGTAFSTGKYRAFSAEGLGEGGSEYSYHLVGADRAYWAQLDVGFELRDRKGFEFLVAVGGALLLNPRDLHCQQGSAEVPCSLVYTSGHQIPTITIALGHAF
jgi:hypothetical protein